VTRLTIGLVALVVVVGVVFTRAAAGTTLQMQRIIRAEFGPGQLGLTMRCIAVRESHLNPKASNLRDANGGSYGLFQINGIWRRPGETTRHFAWRMHNPWNNARMAHRLVRARGLEPWGGGC